MKPRNHAKIPLSIAAAMAGFALASPSAHAQIVYQDNFDNDGLATNAGIGGGLDPYDRQGGPWLDNGELDSNRSGNNDRGNVSSLNTFNLTGGFKLEVTHTISNVTTIDANRAVIGLLDAADLPATQTNTSYITDFLNRDLDKYGIGLNLTVQNSTQGLNFADGSNLNQLSNAQTITTGTQSWVLEVDADGNWSYSIDGAPATTGTSTFDVARDYHFFAYMQDNHNHLLINSATLTLPGGAAPFDLTITPNATNSGNYDFEWDSQADKLYDLVSDISLATAPSSWVVYDPDGPGGDPAYGDIASGGTTTSLMDVPGGGDPKRFFAVLEKDLPPPETPSP